jgi:signal transduction histidine kinase
MSVAPAQSGRRSWLPRPTIRLRLTLLYGGLFLVSGAALLALTYALVSQATGNPFVTVTANGGVVVTVGGFASGQVPIPFLDGKPSPEQLQALATQQHLAELNQLLVFSAVALAVMAVVSVVIGWLVAGRVLRPVRAMTTDVRAISAANLHQRLPLDGPDDELRDLGATFNDLLGRLERSFASQRQFVANASHELRTPLARQRTLLQVALEDPDASVESLRAAGARAVVAGQQQERLIEALFTLARGDRGLDRRERIDIADVAGSVLAAHRPEIDAAGLRLVAGLDRAEVLGDQRLLERLVANLVDNAIRYNLPGGSVEAATATRGGGVVLSIRNTGPDVPAADVARLFEPFQRLGADRTGNGDGWGLGLSIVRAVANAHGARLRVDALPQGGLDIEVVFPAPSPEGR